MAMKCLWRLKKILNHREHGKHGENIMKCPKCGLYNPENSLKCDCGYQFKSGDNSLNRDFYIRKSNKLIIEGIFLIIIGVVVAIFLGRIWNYLTGYDLEKSVGSAIFVFASSGGLIFQGYRIFKRGLMLRK